MNKERSTAKQLLELLGNDSEITIMSDIVHGLNSEYDNLQQENKKMKAELKIYRGALHENHRLIHLLNDLEDWLEEQKKYFQEADGEHGEWNIHIDMLEIVSDKLKKLRDGDE